MIMAENLKPGDKAPAFQANDQNGEQISLEKFSGKKIILYFYPKDNTPGCTSEACSLRDGYDDLLAAGFVVVGVSPDSEKSHRNFAEKHGLPFHLVADTDRKMLMDYGAWGEKKMYGKTYEGVIRTTFVISEEGKIEHVIPKVDTKNHAQQIMSLYH
jgi:thioredoxin-dependent peroxiredoxin